MVMGKARPSGTHLFVRSEHIGRQCHPQAGRLSPWILPGGCRTQKIAFSEDADDLRVFGNYDRADLPPAIVLAASARVQSAPHVIAGVDIKSRTTVVISSPFPARTLDLFGDPVLLIFYSRSANHDERLGPGCKY